jgi:PncC family amidohydrolase
MQKFYQISSTHIRKATQAGHSLETFLPVNTALYISQNCLYNRMRKHKNDPNSSQLNEHQYSCFELKEQLEKAAIKLQKYLAQRAKNGLPHRFSVLETSTGGQIAQTFTSLTGASGHFLDGRIIYDQEAQKQFLDVKEFKDSSVSQTRAQNLASAMQRQSGADWALAETGMAGPPTRDRRSTKNGQCYLGLVKSTEVRYKFLEFSPFLTRKEHQLMFAIEALVWVEKELRIMR